MPTEVRLFKGARFVVVLSFVAGSALAGCGEKSSQAKSADAGADDAPTSPAEVGYDLRRLRPTDEVLSERFDREARAALAEGKRVAVLFSADWCEPCQVLELELGNLHPASVIGDVRIFQLKEEDWESATRMDEVNALRLRWHPTKNSYPVLILLDDELDKREEMKEAKARLEAEGLAPTLPNWLQSTAAEQS